jgi:Photosynthesis system II assembly factor YCF48/Putative zinc-finger
MRVKEIMIEVPKIVPERLRAAGAQAATTHPDADVLTAFAEQALTQPERERVLEHLALCVDCREVVVLALPASEAVAAPVEAEVEMARILVPTRPQGGWFSWSSLRWATLAAGIAVAVLVARGGWEHRARPKLVADSAVQTSLAVQPVVKPTTSGNEVKEMTSAPAAAPEQKTSPAAPAAAASKHRATAKDVRPGAAAAGQLAAQIGGRELPGVAAESSSAGLETGPKSSATPLQATLMADAPAIEKAKPPLPGTDDTKESQPTTPPMQAVAPAKHAVLIANASSLATKGADAAMRDVRWTIAAGVLQRSVDGGVTWQALLQTDHMLLSSANRGMEVWAGGQSGTLLHSLDNGATWSAVRPSCQGRLLESDITHIEIGDQVQVVVLTTASEGTWSSADGGKSWQKN